jgi:putative endonuclease
LARARWAERTVAQWYSTHGYSVIAMNWTMRGGELDVVARRGSLIVVCEVKARASNAYGTPLESITPLKQQRVRRAGFAFVRTLNEPGLSVRFDVATMLGTMLEIYENVL